MSVFLCVCQQSIVCSLSPSPFGNRINGLHHVRKISQNDKTNKEREAVGEAEVKAEVKAEVEAKAEAEDEAVVKAEGEAMVEVEADVEAEVGTEAEV